jgi:hypothetical protein
MTAEQAHLLADCRANFATLREFIMHAPGCVFSYSSSPLEATCTCNRATAINNFLWATDALIKSLDK